MAKQHCAVCAWRANCAKRFSIQDNGSRCPDFSRDVSIKDTETTDTTTDQKKEQPQQ
jgi:hypothetical protein